jgi:hypothetical protein
LAQCFAIVGPAGGRILVEHARRHTDAPPLLASASEISISRPESDRPR